MPPSSKTQHHVLNAGLPYISNSSPVSSDPQYIAGNDILTTIQNIAQRRPGFADAIEKVASSFSALKRIYPWSKWAVGTSAPQFYVMFCDVAGGVAKVYKYAVGSDNSAVLVFTSTSAEPFDFVDSNNTCYFSNGTEAKKFLASTVTDHTAWNWGIAAYGAALVPAVGAGSSKRPAATATGTNWTNPTNILVDDANYAIYNNTTQDDLKVTNFSFSLGSGNIPVGIQVSIKGNGSSATIGDRQIQVGLTKDGSTLVGNRKTGTLNQTTDTTLTFGSSSDLWGSTFSQSEVQASTFGVMIRDADTTAAAINLNYLTVTVYYGPSGSLNAAAGYSYVQTYCNSTTGHESSPNDVSSSTGTFTGSQVSIPVFASSDAQVDQIRVYRTTDGGSTNPTDMRELDGSPYTNTDQTITDTTDDTLLGSRFAPAINRNDPPTPMKGMVWAQGRIWGFNNATTYYSGFEEIDNGVPEECFPSGLDGNVYNWNKQVTGHAAMEDGIAVFLPTDIHKIEGESLDTFRRYKLMSMRGARSRTAVTSVGSTVAWLDTANQVWVSDLGEIGLPIRPDIQSIDHSRASLAVHISGNNHWIVLMDGANGKLFVFDLDTKRWMPPWKVGVTCSALASGETATGNIDMMIGRNGTKALKLNNAAFNDDGQKYQPSGTTGMLWIAQNSDYLERFDKGNPAWRGVVDWVEVKTNEGLSGVSQVNDDDPQLATFTTLENTGDPIDVPQGNYVKLSRYGSSTLTSAARMAAWKLDMSKKDFPTKIYTIDIAYHPDAE